MQPAQPAAVPAKYVKVVFTKNGEGEHITANEIKVFAAEPQ